jgi:hypothetical protein
MKDMPFHLVQKVVCVDYKIDTHSMCCHIVPVKRLESVTEANRIENRRSVLRNRDQAKGTGWCTLGS